MTFIDDSKLFWLDSGCTEVDSQGKGLLED